MTTTNITPIAIFSDLLDGYSVDKIACRISHSDHSVSVEMAEKALKAFSQKEPTPQDQKDVHEVLQWIFDGDSAYELEVNEGINSDDSDAFVAVIASPYNI